MVAQNTPAPRVFRKPRAAGAGLARPRAPTRGGGGGAGLGREGLIQPPRGDPPAPTPAPTTDLASALEHLRVDQVLRAFAQQGAAQVGQGAVGHRLTGFVGGRADMGQGHGVFQREQR